MIPVLRSALAATVLTVAAGASVVGGAAPVQAAGACTTGSGVTVVVDFKSLGGGVQGDCVGSAGSAGSLFRAAGFTLRQAARQPGFVCRISGLPESDPCVNTSPANAYWSLWWSDGRSGRWIYSSLGIGSLKVPDGGSVAFAFDDRAGSARPSFTPPANAPDPSEPPEPTSEPTRQPPRTPSEQPSDPTQEPSTDPAPTETTPPVTPSKTPRPTRRPTSSAPPVPEATSSDTSDDDTVEELAPVEPVDADADSDDGGLPGWVAPGVIVLLFAGAGVALVLRRRGTPAP